MKAKARVSSRLTRRPRSLVFNTIDGFHVSAAEGQAALRSGRAMLVGELLVGSYEVISTSRL